MKPRDPRARARPQTRTHPPVSQIELGRDRVLDALQRILGSSDFIASDRNTRFLQYLIEETLAGRRERLKGYTIALDVFGRDAAFNPNIDPLVRVGARRLRDALERYYLTSGIADPVRISIPKGGYVPVFKPRVSDTPSQPAAQPTSEPPEAKTPAHRTSLLLVASLVTGLALFALVAIAYPLS